MTGILNALIAGVSGAVKDAYFNLVSLLLPGNGTNGAQNNTFLDSGTANSGSGFTITRNGNTTQGTFSPFSQTGWGNYFDGTDDYLSGIGTTSSFNALHQGSPQFTIEAYIYITSAGATYKTIFDTCGYSSAGIGVAFAIADTGKINLFITRGVNGTWVAFGASTTTVPTNQWVHVAVTYDHSLASNNAKFYLNGVADGTANKTANAPSSSNASYAGAIGASGAASDDFFGYISNLRIVNGSSSAPALPISPLTAISGTLLLTCQSNRFKDNSSNNFNITANGIVAVTPFSPFAPTQSYSAAAVGGSGYFDGTLDSLTGPTSNAAFAFGTGAYSVEAWVYLTGFDNGGVNSAFVVDCGGATNAFTMIVNTNGSLALNKYGVGGVITGNSGKIALNSWNHIAICRNSTASNDTRLFVNGVLDVTGTDSNDWTVNTTPTFGGAGNTTTQDVIGYLSGIRIIKSQALATSTFTPPTAPVSASTVGWNGSSTAISGTCSVLLNFTNAGVVDATAKNVLETVGNAQISTTQSKWGGGSISFDGNGDRATMPGSALLALGGGDFTVEGWVYKSANTAYMTLCGNLAVAGENVWQILADVTGNKICWYNGASSSFTITSSATLNTGAWYYIAFVRSGSASNNFKLYINGSLDTQATMTTNYDNTSRPFFLGHTPELSAGRDWNGYVDDFRITKGYARTITASPTAPFPVQ